MLTLLRWYLGEMRQRGWLAYDETQASYQLTAAGRACFAARPRVNPTLGYWRQAT